MGGKLILISALALFFAGCAQDLEISNPETRSEISETIAAVPKLNLDEAVFNEVSGVWMVPQPDPYTLENFQKAYDNLAAGRSKQELSKAERGEFAASKRLEATHYALKIYPRNEEEQWKVEMMEDVQVVYIPFDYVQLTEQDIEKLPQTKSAANGFAEKSPYTITYTDYKTTDGGPTEPRTFQLPILYTVWPATKPLPEDLEYVVDYEIFLPRAAAAQTKSAEALLTLENEAVIMARGSLTMRPATASTTLTRAPAATTDFTAGLLISDNVVGNDVPLVNLKVRYREGSNIQDTYTNSSGGFSITLAGSHAMGVGAILPITITYQDPASVSKWKICMVNSTTPLTQSRNVSLWVPNPGNINYWWPNSLSQGSRQENIIHRAVEYFYYRSSGVPKYSSQTTGGLRIETDSNSHSTYKGKISWPNNYDLYNPPWITIYNNGLGPGSVIGTTLHEIGHFVHLWPDRNNNYDNIENTDYLLCESWASFVGWYFGEEYYRTLGWTKSSLSQDITEQARQSWTKTSSSEYSPLFVDLFDDFNQRTQSSYRPQDEIMATYLSAYDIWSIISTSVYWPQCLSKLQGYVGRSYTSTQFNNWIVDFEYWAANN